VGISDTPAWIVAEANTLAELRGWSRFAGLQVPYSLVDRSVERALLPMVRHWDMAVLAWGVLEDGLLTGKYMTAGDESTRMNRAEVNPKTMALLKALQDVAQETGHSMAQVAINWVRQQERNLIPIIGARSEKQLRDNLGVLDFRLTDAQCQALSQASQFQAGFPNSFLQSDHMHRMIFGETFDLLHNHRA